MKKILCEAINNILTERQRQVIIMYYFEKKVMQEIADELNVNKSTVCRTLHRAENRIKKFKRYFPEVA